MGDLIHGEVKGKDADTFQVFLFTSILLPPQQLNNIWTDVIPYFMTEKTDSERLSGWPQVL